VFDRASVVTLIRVTGRLLAHSPLAQ